MDKQKRNVEGSQCLLALSVLVFIVMMMSGNTTHAAIYEMDPNDQITLQSQQVVTVSEPDHTPLKIDESASLIAKRINKILNRLFSGVTKKKTKCCCKKHKLRRNQQATGPN